jgi:Kef-type K+ transport system membrane component KefB
MAHLMVRFVVQLAVIVIAARLAGLGFKRWLRLPSVLGELVVGMVIGPYALGAIPLSGYGPLFSLGDSGFPVTTELYALATLASVVLLFLAGLETDLVAFLRYAVVGTLVGLGGVIFAFFLGAACAVWFGAADSLLAAPALFLGAISTATSVGITARILSEKRKSDSPEGVTILAGAVVDDVLCVLVLAVAVGLSQATAEGHAVAWGSILRVGGKALAFWLVSMALSMVLAPGVSRLMKQSESHEAMAALSLGLALMLAGLSEMAGLAMIIGAYVTGLAFSRTDLVEVIQEQLHGLYETVVPVFFCVMGMLVDFRAMQGVVVFGLVYSLLAIVAKIVGCALPAYLTQFNARGALRIGVGMLPRGEVALVVAGIGLASGALGRDLFGVAVMMTALTTLTAPPILVGLLTERSGLRHPERAAREEREEIIHLPMPVPEIAVLMADRLVHAFRGAGFFVHRLSIEEPTYHFRRDGVLFTMRVEGSQLRLFAPHQHAHLARFIALEELVSMKSLSDAYDQIKELADVQRQLASTLFTAR